jgi:mannose-6-phosphate isomerase-like protein (cupin superfamily)
VPYEDRTKIYCNEECKAKYVNKDKIKKVSKCLMCQNDFEHNGEKIVCSKDCNLKYVKQNNICPDLDKTRKIEKKCLRCQKDFHYFTETLEGESIRDYCSLACSHDISNIENEHEKDKYSEKTFWDIISSGLMSASKIVKKPWGAEIHITNNNEYCLKYLVFYSNKQFSHHKHLLKKELWHCIYGKFECVLEKKDKKEYFIFDCGDKVEVEPGVLHQLQSLQNSILVEVSTRSYDEDSIRLINGIN